MTALGWAIKKYGQENFQIDVLEWTENYNQRERELIEQYNTRSPNGYNIAEGGEDPPHFYGEEHPNSIITEAQVDFVIEELKKNDLTEPQIGQLFDPPFNQTLINSINWGMTHRRDTETYPIRTQCPYNLTLKEVDEIKWLLANSKHTCYQIADYYHVNASSVKAINTGRNYFDPALSYPIRTFRGEKQSLPVEAILAKRSTNAIGTHSETGVCA